MKVRTMPLSTVISSYVRFRLCSVVVISMALLTMSSQPNSLLQSSILHGLWSGPKETPSSLLMPTKCPRNQYSNREPRGIGIERIYANCRNLIHTALLNYLSKFCHCKFCKIILTTILLYPLLCFTCICKTLQE